MGAFTIGTGAGMASLPLCLGGLVREIPSDARTCLRSRLRKVSLHELWQPSLTQRWQGRTSSHFLHARWQFPQACLTCLRLVIAATGGALTAEQVKRSRNRGKLKREGANCRGWANLFHKLLIGGLKVFEKHNYIKSIYYASGVKRVLQNPGGVSPPRIIRLLALFPSRGTFGM